MELTRQVLGNYPGNNSESVPERYIGNYDFYVEKSAQVGERLIADLQKEEGSYSGRSSADTSPCCTVQRPAAIASRFTSVAVSTESGE